MLYEVITRLAEPRPGVFRLRAEVGREESLIRDNRLLLLDVHPDAETAAPAPAQVETAAVRELRGEYERVDLHGNPLLADIPLIISVFPLRRSFSSSEGRFFLLPPQVHGFPS